MWQLAYFNNSCKATLVSVHSRVFFLHNTDDTAGDDCAANHPGDDEALDAAFSVWVSGSCNFTCRRCGKDMSGEAEMR